VAVRATPKYLKSETSLLGSLDSRKTLAVMLEQQSAASAEASAAALNP
jgi:hypothetical protein